MATSMKPADGSLTLAEIKEFASFDAAAQRYIRRSLDVAYCRSDALALWSRDVVEAASIRAQTKTYEHLPSLRQAIPEDSGLSQIDGFVGLLIRVSAFDLGQDRISSFGAYRFLYERLIGANVRPWPTSSFPSTPFAACFWVAPMAMWLNSAICSPNSCRAVWPVPFL